MFTILSSLEMFAVFHLCGILHISTVIPLRWLAGNSHLLAKYNWSTHLMGRALGLLKDSLEKIVEKPSLIHSREYMMNIFIPLADEMKDFQDFLTHKFEKQKMKVINDETNMKVTYFAIIRDELFCPTNTDNRKSISMLEHLAPTVEIVIIDDMMNQKKVTHKYLSC